MIRLSPCSSLYNAVRSNQRQGISTYAKTLRLAVIGGGPAGFYTSYRVLSKLENVRIDMYESLPVPYGLVRYGVAPDHPEVKNCQEKFKEVAESPRFTYIGNTPIGTSWPHCHHNSLPLSVLAPHYDAFLFSYGASRDRTLSIPGEETLEGVYSARAFVGWYNGLPEYRNLNPRLDGENAVIIGQGNVALDVARILLSDVDTLRKTDITGYALDALSSSQIKNVQIFGRRGPLQAAFTTKELRELMSIPGVGLSPVDLSLYPTDASILTRQQKRILQLLQRGSSTNLREAKKSWELKFLRSPKSFLPSKNDCKKLGAIEFEKTRLQDMKAIGTDEYEEFPADTGFRSIGYLSEPIPGLAELDIPFDIERGLIPNEEGRVVRSNLYSDCDSSRTVVGTYTSGWVKRGPTGVIASTMYDAFDTADAIVNDWVTGQREFMNHGKKTAGWDAVKEEASIRRIRSVSWDEWQKIDAAERHRGKLAGKDREKFACQEEMLSVL
ncbi:hypothetical protein EDC01DRAFT_621572 [Geopyxis carbonaria]|nr:hypothetical protein EDC01DRAFT_621572 [Geopyxis carbonaria]